MNTQKGYTKVDNVIILSRQLDSQSIVVFIYICIPELQWSSLDGISKATGLSKSSVQRSIKKLISKGFVIKITVINTSYNFYIPHNSETSPKRRGQLIVERLGLTLNDIPEKYIHLFDETRSVKGGLIDYPPLSNRLPPMVSQTTPPWSNRPPINPNLIKTNLLKENFEKLSFEEKEKAVSDGDDFWHDGHRYRRLNSKDTIMVE